LIERNFTRRETHSVASPAAGTWRLLNRLAAVAVGAGLAAFVPTAAWAQTAPTSIAVLYHADLDGRLGVPPCGRTERAEPGYAALVSTIRTERAREQDTGHLAPVVLLGGNVLGSTPLARAVLDHGPAGRRTFADILVRAGYDAVALGHRELSAAPDELEAVLRELARQGVPAVASNLHCAGARETLCQVTRRELIIDRGGEKLGLVATIAPAVLGGVPPDRRGGLRLDDPFTTIAAAVRSLRQRGAARVLAMVQVPRGAAALGEVDALARRLTGGAMPDALLAGGLWDEEDGRPVLTVRREGAAPVVGSTAGAAGMTKVSLDAGGQPTAIDWIRAGGEPADGVIEKLLEPETAGYCDRYGASAAPGPVRGVLTRDGFLDYVLQVLRRRAGAEVAVINRGFVKRAPFPIAGELSRGELRRALPYSGQITVTKMPAAEVEKLAPLLANRAAAVVGLTVEGGATLVNGRPLNKVRSYRVATVDFVAGGGDGLLAPPPSPSVWRAPAGNPELVQTVEQFLAGQTASEDGDPGVDVKTDFGPPPVARPLLVGVGDLGFDLLNTQISNDAAYGDAQLVRAEQLSLKGEATAVAQLRLPVHEADANFNAKYGWSRNKPAGGVPAAGETADLVSLTTTYNYRGLRQHPRLPAPAVPDPYVRGRLETEVTRPPLTAKQTRTYRHFELTATAGGLFTIATKLRLRAGAGVRSELLADGTAGRWRPVIEAGAVLDPIALASFGNLVSRLEGTVDYNFVDPTGTREHQLRAGGKLSFPLLPLLFLTAGLDVFAVERSRSGWATSYDTTVGLRVHFDAAHQSL